MGDTLFRVLTSAGGSAIVCGALIAALWKWGFDAILERFKRSQSEETEKLKTYLSLELARASRFEDAEFRAYDEVWDALARLRGSANRLWAHATSDNMDAFAANLAAAHETIYGTELAIDRARINELRGVIHSMEHFYEGKGGLIELRAQQPVDANAITAQIQHNDELRTRFAKAVDDLGASIYESRRSKATTLPHGV